MGLAAIQEACPVVHRDPVADVVIDGIAMHALLDDARQEPASGAEVGQWLVEHVEAVLVLSGFSPERGMRLGEDED